MSRRRSEAMVRQGAMGEGWNWARIEDDVGDSHAPVARAVTAGTP